MNAAPPRPAHPLIRPLLSGVPETALWTLHDRAMEAARADGILRDPEAIRLREALDLDFLAHFGPGDGAFAARSQSLDGLVKDWLARHPAGQVIALGEGLETQAHRVDNGQCTWLSVDMAEVIRLRRRLLPETGRFRCMAASALDESWMEAEMKMGPSRRPRLIIMQGLLMYFAQETVASLLNRIAVRFPDAAILFDTVPAWFTALTQQGLPKTARFTVPPMLWGIDRDRIAPALAAWGVPHRIRLIPYGAPRGMPWMLSLALSPQSSLHQAGTRFPREKLPVIVALDPPLQKGVVP